MTCSTRCWVSETHMAINTLGNVSPCCRYNNDLKLNLLENTVSSSFNNSKLQQVRENLKNNVRDLGCVQCWNEEDSGLKSMRINHNEHQPVDFSLLTGELSDVRSLEIAFSNHCNMKCRHCRTSNSSKWKDDDILLGRYIPDKLLQQPEILASDLSPLTNLKMIKILGGEPFLSKSHSKFILELDRIENLQIEYTTNGSIYPSREILNRWKLLENLQITISLDDVEQYFDYFRSDGNFQQVKQNIDKFLKLISPKVTVGFHIVVNVLNAYRMSKLLKYILQNFPTCSFIHIDKIHEPTFLKTNQWNQHRLINESKRIKKLIREYKLKDLEIYFYRASNVLLAESKNAENNFDNFLKVNSILDKSRKTKLTEVHPVFKNFINKDYND